jgi:hypothetical protein
MYVVIIKPHLSDPAMSVAERVIGPFEIAQTPGTSPSSSTRKAALSSMI